jgi:hypothetical protein
MIREWAMKKVHNNIIHNLWWILQPFYFRVWLITVVKYKTRRDPNVVIANKEDTYQWVYKNLPKKHHVLRKVPTCEYCGALRFNSETPGFCCRKGKVHIYVHDLPFEIRHLFESQTDCDANYFRTNICYFNSHFFVHIIRCYGWRMHSHNQRYI